jgi:hypothetical protein
MGFILCKNPCHVSWFQFLFQQLGILSFPAPKTFVSSNSADGNPPIKLKL